MGRKKYLDQTDINLLNTLKARPTYSIAELGKVVDLSPGPTHTRLTNLRQKGILKDDYKINYSKLGLKEKVCMFEIKDSNRKHGVLNPHRIFTNIVKKLQEADFILIERVELFSDDDDNHWIMIRFYPLFKGKRETDLKGNKRMLAYEVDISGLLMIYLGSDHEKYLHLMSKVESAPMLTAVHRMKNEPPL